MKMYEIFLTEIFKTNQYLRDKLRSMIEKHYPHLRHSLRGEIEVDIFLMNEIFSIIKTR